MGISHYISGTVTTPTTGGIYSLAKTQKRKKYKYIFSHEGHEEHKENILFRPPVEIRG